MLAVLDPGMLALLEYTPTEWLFPGEVRLVDPFGQERVLIWDGENWYYKDEPC